MRSWHSFRFSTTQTNTLSPVIIDDIGVPTLNFVHLIHQYSLLFTISNPEIAFQYLLTISVLDDGNSNNKRATELCRSYIEELVTNTRAYSVLLGCRTVDDKVERGCIDEFKDLIQVDDAFIRSLTVAAADKCRHEERHADAVALYYLVGVSCTPYCQFFIPIQLNNVPPSRIMWR